MALKMRESGTRDFDFVRILATLAIDRRFPERGYFR